MPDIEASRRGREQGRDVVDGRRLAVLRAHVSEIIEADIPLLPRGQDGIKVSYVSKNDLGVVLSFAFEAYAHACPCREPTLVKNSDNYVNASVI